MDKVVIPMEFIVLSISVVSMTNLIDTNAVKSRLEWLMELEEDRFIVGFVQKYQHKSWHGRNIKRNEFQLGSLVLMYDSKLLKHAWKFRIHWLGPYKIDYITEVGAMKMFKM